MLKKQTSEYDSLKDEKIDKMVLEKLKPKISAMKSIQLNFDMPGRNRRSMKITPTRKTPKI